MRLMSAFAFILLKRVLSSRTYSLHEDVSVPLLESLYEMLILTFSLFLDDCNYLQSY